MAIQNLPPLPSALSEWVDKEGKPTPAFFKFMAALLQALKNVP